MYLNFDAKLLIHSRNPVAKLTARHNVQSAMLLSELGFGHILLYAPVSLILSALHLAHSYAPLQGGGVAKLVGELGQLSIEGVGNG